MRKTLHVVGAWVPPGRYTPGVNIKRCGFLFLKIPGGWIINQNCKKFLQEKKSLKKKRLDAQKCHHLRDVRPCIFSEFNEVPCEGLNTQALVVDCKIFLIMLESKFRCFLPHQRLDINVFCVSVRHACI